MTNPDNAVGTNAAYSGRTSVNAFNDDLAVYSRGIMSGWACAPDSGMTVALGGDGNTRDVAVAEDNAGNKTTINNISGAPVSVTIEAAPANNSRIDAIVAYVDNPPQGSSTIADNYEACGLISVSGTASSSPVEPSDGAIRSAITADGASGATAYYVVLATVTVASGTTDITADVITPGVNAMIQARNVGGPEIVGAITSNSYAIKYPDGRLTCYLRVTASITGWTATGSIYYGNQQTTRPNYAVPFKYNPRVVAQINPNYGGANGWLYHSTTSPTTQDVLTRPPKYNICRGASISGTAEFTVDIIAEGFWK